MSCVVAAASELIAPACVLIVAATIAATTRPSKPGGIRSTMKVGKTASGAAKLRPCITDQSPIPINRKRVNCANTAIPLPITRSLRVAQRARGEQPLHDELVGAVRRHREEGAAEQPSEERLRPVEARVQVDHAQLARRRGVAEDAVPAARRDAPDEHDRRRAAEEVDPRLEQLRPDHGAHPAAVRVEHGERAEHEDRRHHRSALASPSPSAGPTMSATGIAVAKTRTESASARVTMNTMDVNRRVATPKRVSSRVYAVTSSPVVVAREEHARDDDASEDVAGGDLQESEIAEVGEPGDRDEGERARLGGDDGEHHRPPRDRAVGDEVVGGVLLAAAEPQPQRG